MKKILTPYPKGNFSLKNHIVMAPMTRSRAIGNIPNDLMVEYYQQRSGAGLIVTEGVAPTPEGLGYSRIPGIFSEEQIRGWRKVADAVHKNDAKIFMQFMHTGRIGHNHNLPEDKKIIGVSDIKASGQLYVDGLGMQDYADPKVLTTAEVKELIKGHVQAAQNAVEANFDGVELHGAHGYLSEQFLNPNVNTRTDEYGGSIVNRARFVVETIEQMAAAIGKEKVGIRISPCSTFNDLKPYDLEEVHETYSYLAQELNRIGIAYIHLSFNTEVPQKTLDAIRGHFHGTLILCNGLTPETAEQALEKGFADLVGFGRAYISNPDLDKRIALGVELAQLNPETLYSADAAGYIDYPTL